VRVSISFREFDDGAPDALRTRIGDRCCGRSPPGCRFGRIVGVWLPMKVLLGRLGWRHGLPAKRPASRRDIAAVWFGMSHRPAFTPCAGRRCCDGRADIVDRMGVSAWIMTLASATEHRPGSPSRDGDGLLCLHTADVPRSTAGCPPRTTCPPPHFALGQGDVTRPCRKAAMSPDCLSSSVRSCARVLLR